MNPTTKCSSIMIFINVIVAEQATDRVTNLRVTNTNSRRIRISWTGVSEATGYRVTWRQENSTYRMLSIILSSRTFPHSGFDFVQISAYFFLFFAIFSL